MHGKQAMRPDTKSRIPKVIAFVFDVLIDPYAKQANEQPCNVHGLRLGGQPKLQVVAQAGLPHADPWQGVHLHGIVST